MADNVTLKTKILLRNDTKEQWTSVNPVLGKGELGIESDTRLFKFGDGVTAWKDLKYADTEHAVLKDADPIPSDASYSLGTKWVNTTNKKVFLLLGITEGSADWQQIALMKDLSGLGAGDMLKSQFATNEKVEQGYVDKAIAADTATKATSADTATNATNAEHATSADTATNAENATNAATANKLASAQNITLTGDATGSASFDGSAEASIAVTLKDSGVSGGTYTKVTVDSKGIVTSAENITAEDLPSGISVDKIEGLGTAAKANTGTAEGNVPVIGSGNTLDVSIIPNITLSKVTDAGTAASKNTGTAEGDIPILGTEGKLDESVLPALAITDTFEVDSQEAMLGLEAQKGDVAVRSDVNKSFILKQIPASEIGNWVELRTPTDTVLSVNSKTGAVVLTTDDIGEGSTNQYFTEERAKSVFDTNFSTAFDDALAGKTTDNLPQGTTNKYYGEDLFNASLSGKSTDDVKEGSTNLYYTEDRASANFKTHASTELTDSASLLRNTDTFIIDGGNASGAEA